MPINFAVATVPIPRDRMNRISKSSVRFDAPTARASWAFCVFLIRQTKQHLTVALRGNLTTSLVVAVGLAAFANIARADELDRTSESNAHAKPNIVFIMIDDLGWMDLACQGNPLVETPNIDSLANQGVRFTDHYAAAPVCSPTRASIMTGKAPARLRITNHLPDQKRFTPKDAKLLPAECHDHLPLEEVTIAERLKAAGYSTAFIGKWHLSQRGNTKFQPEYQGFDINIGGCEALLKKYENRTGPGLNDTRYGAMIEAMDSAIGRILTALDELKLADDTLLIFTSDNGAFGGVGDNRPLREEKGYLYEGGIRVPLIVRWPGHTESGTTCSTPTISTDFFSTLLDAADIPLGAGDTLDGVSLVPLFEGDAINDRSIYFHYPNYAFHRGNRLGSSVRRGKYKLIDYYDSEACELYDLEADISEAKNLANSKPVLVQELRNQLLKWRKFTNAAKPVVADAK